MADTYNITIVRFDASADTEPYETSYEVPDDPDFAPMTALKALHHINRYAEPIGYDFNCRRGSCGRCGIMVDGEPRLACMTPLTGNHTFAPLDGFPVIRDLIVDKSVAYGKFLDSEHVIKTLKADGVLQPMPYSDYTDKMYPLNFCRECMCCYAGCQALQDFDRWGSFAGPGAMQQMYMRHNDTMDQSDRIGQAAFAGLFECVQCGNCTKNCPSLIPGAENIKEMMDEAEARGLKPDTDSRTKYWPML